MSSRDHKRLTIKKSRTSCMGINNRSVKGSGVILLLMLSRKWCRGHCLRIGEVKSPSGSFDVSIVIDFLIYK